jgi:hypothetical protein
LREALRRSNLEAFVNQRAPRYRRGASRLAMTNDAKDGAMTANVTLYDPTAPRRETQDAPGTAKAALTSLAGKTVGFIDNAKPNFHVLVDDLGELLTSKYGVARVVKRRKPSASIPAKPEIVAELSDACDVVITGSGD